MMIWTLEAAPPWRITAADRDRDEEDLFLDRVAVEDRGVVASALAATYTQGAGSCDCGIQLDTDLSAIGDLKLVRVSAHDGTRHIVAIWNDKKNDSDAVAKSPAGRVVDDQTMRQFLGQVSHDLRT